MRITLSAEFLSVSAASLSAQELPAGFGWFGTMVGSCWIGQFPDGRTEHTQCYSGQFGKFMRGTASLSSAKETARQVLFEGDSLFAWDDASKRIVYYIWGSDGTHRQLQAQYIGEELHFPVPSRTDPTQVSYRSVWRRIDASSFEVRRERPRGEQWATELIVTYRKAPSGAEPKR
jgi:hypothetical protein